MKFRHIIYIILLVTTITYSKNERPYGVFLGLNSKQISRLNDYKTVVIEPTEFSEKQIRTLKKQGKTVYAYLNIGTIENYRPYYSNFTDILLKIYDDWPNERWVDVSSEKWQKYVVNILAKKYVDMGFDGFFVDNTDVYYQYKKHSIYYGLCSILRGLKKYNVQIIINGGDYFVNRCIDEEIANELFDAVNQETVFTSIDFKDKKYGLQNETDHIYFLNYLEKVNNSGLSVYLLEYGSNRSLSKKIDEYCKANGFIWYDAKGFELK